MNVIDKFKPSFDSAVAYIEKMRKDKDIGIFVEWLLNTKVNPYGFLSEKWAGFIICAEGFESLVHHIHHAAVDDGEMELITVNGEPRIVFAHRYESYFRKVALSSTEQELEKHNKEFAGKHNKTFKLYEIKFLERDINTFGQLYDEYYKKDIKRCFLLDAKVDGLDFAIKHYKEDYADLFEEAWIKEFKNKGKNK